MGSSQSIGIPDNFTHESLFKLTEEPRLIMSYLLEYMLKEVTVRDFLLLSNPEQCSKYVLFMTNNISKFFYELKIQPIKEKSGVIAFRSIKDISTPQSDQEKTEKDSLCLILSYFYTRIFQIYGALALTLIDDINIMSSSGILSYMSKDGQQLLAPGYRSYYTSGGDFSTDIGNFNFLRSFLTSSLNDNTGGYITQYQGSGTSISFTIAKSNNMVGVFHIKYADIDKPIYLEISAKSYQSTMDIELVFGSMRYYKLGEKTLTSEELPYTIINRKQFIIEPNYSVNPPTYRIKDNAIQGINEFFMSLFNKIVPYSRNRIKEFVQNASKSIQKPELTTTTEKGTEEQLRLHRIITNLTRVKPLGHCIARALQLLKTLPLKNEEGISSICKAKFLEIPGSDGAKSVRSGIPPRDKPLEESPGLSALSQLFYDTITVGTPKIQIGIQPGPNGQSSLQQYILFMRNMATLFGDKYDVSKQERPDKFYIDNGLKGIKNRRDKDLCVGIPEDIRLSASIKTKVHGIVTNMFKIQYEHANLCGKIFKMLFNIAQNKDTGRRHITLSENIISKGLPEIDRVNHLARDLLIKYYSNCETQYVMGMKEVLDGYKTASAAAAAAAAPTAPTVVAPTATAAPTIAAMPRGLNPQQIKLPGGPTRNSKQNSKKY